ncbi:MAG: phospholipase, partial [Vicinamibacteria bacterium]
MTRVHTIETRIHGRYLSAMPDGPGPHPWLLGCHGYGEAAPQQMAVLERLDPERRWGRVSVQGLHRFYTRNEEIVASWMTREDRDLAIADNVAYVGAVVDEVRRTLPVGDPLVLVGFSQGAAMAYRAAAAGLGARGLVVLAGDVPPDVAPRAGALPTTLVG